MFNRTSMIYEITVLSVKLDSKYINLINDKSRTIGFWRSCCGLYITIEREVQARQN